MDRIGHRLFMFVLLWVVGSVLPQDASARCESLECQLASIHVGYTVDESHAGVLRSRLLLNQIRSKVRNTHQEIADMTVKAQQLLRQQGHRMALLDVMECLNRSIPASASSLHLHFADVAAAYVTLKGTKR